MSNNSNAKLLITSIISKSLNLFASNLRRNEKLWEFSQYHYLFGFKKSNNLEFLKYRLKNVKDKWMETKEWNHLHLPTNEEEKQIISLLHLIQGSLGSKVITNYFNF